MTSENRFDPEKVREIAQNFPDVKRLMIERAQIKQDARQSPTYTKLEPYPKPKDDIYHPKNHKESDSNKTAREKLFDNKLEENSKEIESSFHYNFKEAGLEQMSDWAKEMNIDELTIFMEEGYDEVLERREEKNQTKSQTLDLEGELKMGDKQSKEIFGEPENNKELSDLQEKDIHLDIDIEEDLKMDTKESEKLFEREQNLNDFKDNLKEMDISKNTSPSDEFE